MKETKLSLNTMKKGFSGINAIIAAKRLRIKSSF